MTSLGERANRLLELKGVSFRWLDSSRFDNNTHFGFIAQEVESVFPEIVRESQDGVRSLQMDAVGPLLVEAFRMLQRRVVSLEEELRSASSTLKEITMKLGAPVLNDAK